MSKKTDTDTAFKNWINPQVVKSISQTILKIYPKFPEKHFITSVGSLEPLELKQRVQAIRTALKSTLPSPYPIALEILVKASKHWTGGAFGLWPFLDFIHSYGLDHQDISMEAMKTLTPSFSAEFAVRPFLAKNPGPTYNQLLIWTKHSDPHVRRWCSEGSRPRLPWGERLFAAIKNPKPGLKILEKLKYDSSLYVRKSVANHLNDVAKDHPEEVINLLKKWKKQSPSKHLNKIEWIISRSLRTLIKQGHGGALALLDVNNKPKLRICNFKILNPKVKFPGYLEFSFLIKSKGTKSQKLIVDYIIHHNKSNNTLSPKVFKLKTSTLEPNEELSVTKRHPLKKITTRKYYPGVHALEIQINGNRMTKKTWYLSF